MARRYAPLLTSIWDNEGFRSLTPTAQRMYLQILSQRRLSLCGVVPYQVRNWARACDHLGEHDIEQAVAELVANEYVWVDHETEELHVRTMLKHDPPRGPRTVIGMWNDWKEIDSPRIRHRVIHSLTDEIWETKGVDIPDEAFALRNTPLDTPSDTPSDGGRQKRYPQETDSVPPMAYSPNPPAPLPPSSAPSSCEDHRRTDDDRIDKIVQTVANIRIQANPPKSNPDKYRQTVERSVRAEKLERIHKLAAMCRPDTPISVLAGAAESGDTRHLAHWLHTPEPEPEPNEPPLTREQRTALLKASKDA